MQELSSVCRIPTLVNRLLYCHVTFEFYALPLNASFKHTRTHSIIRGNITHQLPNYDSLTFDSLSQTLQNINKSYSMSTLTLIHIQIAT